MQEIFISKRDDKRIVAIADDGVLQELYEEKDNSNRLEGNIYLGIIKDVLPGMQAAFVDIGEEKNTFLHIKDLIPKVSTITGNKEEDLKKYNIKDYAKKDMPLLVQVKKDATNIKGAKISTDINLPGRFVVLIPNDKFITVSQKIEDEKERQRLIKIAQEITKNEVGLIIRTAANKKSEDEIKEDIIKTIDKWNTIKKKYDENKKNNKPCVLFENSSIIEKILLGTVDNGVENVYVDDKDIYNDVNGILKEISLKKSVSIEYIKDNLLSKYDIDDQIEETSKRKIWLKCGGFITIDKTEALTAIDVNSGKFTGKQSLEQTVLKVNKEASVEIARQLRLRDIGGIIVIDYIDMSQQESRNKILEILREELKKDRSKTQIIEFTKLDLLEMTRKHMFSNE